MKKIDSYILNKFLTTFFFCLLLFTAIVIVIDISEKTDDFVRSRLPISRIIRDYYFGLVPRIDAMLFPLFVFIAVIFFTAKMAERSEVIAILSSGVSFRRFLFPYWIGSIFLAMILWLVYQFVLPRANAIWGTFQARYVDYSPTDSRSFPQNYYFRLDSNSYAGIKYYDTSTKAGGNFFIQEFENNRLKYNLRAENISWDTAKRKWKMNTVMERFFINDKEAVKHHTTLLMNYNFRPVDLRKDEYLKDRLPTPELKEFIRKEQLRGSEGINALLVERYNRDAIPASVIILSMIGASLASQRVRGGSGLHLAIGLILSVLYILFGRLSLVFATKGSFTPVLAAWAPNLIFGTVAYFLYRRAAR
jgi:lipopolysaccharide export system permease protein